MEETLKLILNKLEKLDVIEKELKKVNERLDILEEGQKETKGQIDHLTKETFKITVKLEDKIDKGLQALDFKLDKIYVNTVGVSKQFTDVTKQELPVINHRLHDHEDRITDLEARV